MATKEQKKLPETEIGKSAISAIAELAKEMLRDAPIYVRWLSYTAAITAIVLIVLAITFIAKDYPGYALAAFLSAIALLVGASYLLHRFLRDVRHVISGQPVWQRVVMKKVDNIQQFRTLGDYVEEIRRTAHEWLKNRGYDSLKNHMIRANIFLPKYGDEMTTKGYLFQLYMEPALRRRMDKPEEWDIRFQPGEGGTGVAYQEGSPRTNILRNFQLTEEQKNLKWFINIPLRDPTNYTVLGVLNVDGIEQDIDEGTLEQLQEELMDRKQGLEKELANLPKVTLILMTADITAIAKQTETQ